MKTIRLLASVALVMAVSLVQTQAHDNTDVVTSESTAIAPQSEKGASMPGQVKPKKQAAPVKRKANKARKLEKKAVKHERKAEKQHSKAAKMQRKAFDKRDDKNEMDRSAVEQVEIE